MTTCKVCGKEITGLKHDGNGILGLCKKHYFKQYHSKNKAKIAEQQRLYGKEYRQKNKLKLKKRKKKYYDEHRDKINKKQRLKYQTDKYRLTRKRWYKKNHIEILKRKRIYAKKYSKTVNGKKIVSRINEKWRRAHPEHIRAYKMAGKIPLRPCVVCGKFPAHRHHPDILKPYEVIFLCPLHHKQIHVIV
jgi:hypothetical protein